MAGSPAASPPRLSGTAVAHGALTALRWLLRLTAPELSLPQSNLVSACGGGLQLGRCQPFQGGCRQHRQSRLCSNIRPWILKLPACHPGPFRQPGGRWGAQCWACPLAGALQAPSVLGPGPARPTLPAHAFCHTADASALCGGVCACSWPGRLARRRAKNNLPAAARSPAAAGPLVNPRPLYRAAAIAYLHLLLHIPSAVLCQLRRPASARVRAPQAQHRGCLQPGP